MNGAATVLGIPAFTFFVGGGLFLLSTILPSMIVLIIELRKRGKKDE